MSTGEQVGAPAGTDHVVGVAQPQKMNRYLWLVLVSAFLAWMFDSIALNVFNLILTPSMAELLHTNDRGVIVGTGGLIVAIKLVAWGIGGTVFGVLTDRFGRARIMLVTIVIYAVFTGLSALAQDWVQLAICQAIAGLGIGGEWSAGAALLAESLPERLRSPLMIVMQLAFSVGYFFAAVVNLAVGAGGWRWVLFWCAIPAVLVIVLRLFVKEPERWVRTQEKVEKVGRLRRLFEPGPAQAHLGRVPQRDDADGRLVRGHHVRAVVDRAALGDGWPGGHRPRRQLLRDAAERRRDHRLPRADLAHRVADRAPGLVLRLRARRAAHRHRDVHAGPFDERRARGGADRGLLHARRVRGVRGVPARALPDPRCAPPGRASASTSRGSSPGSGP